MKRLFVTNLGALGSGRGTNSLARPIRERNYNRPLSLFYTRLDVTPAHFSTSLLGFLVKILLIRTPPSLP